MKLQINATIIATALALTVFASITLLTGYGTPSARAGDKPESSVVSLAYDPGTGSLLKSDGRVLSRSGNGGKTWETLPLLPSVSGSIAAVATPAEGNGVVYVAGPGLGVLRTEDDGANWIALNAGLPSTDVTALATHATLPDTLYAYLPKGGIYRSQDAGKTWKLMDLGPDGTDQLIHTDMQGSMETGWLYATTAQGARVSMDCFCLWRDAGDLSGEVYSLAYDPRQPEHLYASSEEGLFRSTNGGQEWARRATPETAVTALIVTPSGTLYAASIDDELFRSANGAKTWEHVGG